MAELETTQQHLQVLQKELAEKDAEINQLKSHINELNMHSEAQAREYKQKFKELEAMAQQIKADAANSSQSVLASTKTEKTASKPRGSGSPFKCIGLGLVQQINSEKDEELNAAKHKIEELELLAVSRQKEIFMLNARLAAAESMTHDVIRDLLGVKLDMTNYATILDNHDVPKVQEAVQHDILESAEKDNEMLKLKRQLKEFVEERKCWLDEIDQRHSEMVAARMMAEKLKQQCQYLTTENEILKSENSNYKKTIGELEDDVQRLSSQQNLQHRIHHHVKTKEENSILKIQNEELQVKLNRSQEILSRLKDEIAHYRACGKNPLIDFEEEQNLWKKLQASEEDRIQLAAKLLKLCTSILKVAGITEPSFNIDPSAAEDALHQIKDRINSLEDKVEDLKLKCKILNEKIRLHEIGSVCTSDCSIENYKGDGNSSSSSTSFSPSSSS